MKGLFRLSAPRVWGSWKSLVTAMVVVLIFGTPGLILAEEPAKEEFRDRLMIRAG